KAACGASSKGERSSRGLHVVRNHRYEEPNPCRTAGPRHDGIVVDHMFGGNIVGNGSAALMRKSAISEAGSYDPSLRARDAEGLEDHQLYFRIATRHEFSVVPEHLTGYRRRAASMSGNVRTMLRSRDILAGEMCSKYPERAPMIRASRFFFLIYLYDIALGN